MSTCGRLWGAALAVLVSASVAGAQSLGELAAKEKERREKERQKRGGATKVLTEDDLRGGGRGTMSNAGAVSNPEGEASAAAPAATASPAEGAAPADGAAPATPAEGAAPAEAAQPAQPAQPAQKTDDEVKAEQQKEWRTRLQAAREEVTQLTDRVNRLQTGLNDLSGPMYGSTRTAMLEQWETAKKDLATAQQNVTNLEEEGRRKNFR
jgi:hypothetical protein